jgi:enoyl-CoA hydratase/carnithine racemase
MFPDLQFRPAAVALLAALLAAPAGAVRATKALLRGAGTRSYDVQRAAERAAQAGRLRDLAGQL